MKIEQILIDLTQGVQALMVQNRDYMRQAEGLRHELFELKEENQRLIQELHLMKVSSKKKEPKYEPINI